MVNLLLPLLIIGQYVPVISAVISDENSQSILRTQIRCNQVFHNKLCSDTFLFFWIVSNYYSGINLLTECSRLQNI